MSKTNKAGRECPAWCERNHENDTPYTCNKTGPFIGPESAWVWAWADLTGAHDASPEIGIHAATYQPSPIGSLSFTSRESAENAAALMENLADHSPDHHRELAAQLREYAAAAWPEKEAEVE